MPGAPTWNNPSVDIAKDADRRLHNEFMVQHPWFAGILAVVLGAIIAPFFLRITNH